MIAIIIIQINKRKITNINFKTFSSFRLSARNALQNVHVWYASYTSLTLRPIPFSPQIGLSR